MADCKTMMIRRNSRDLLGACGSRSSGTVGHPPPPPPPHPHHHPHHRNNSRSRSYYHHLPLQHNYYNQCHYYNTPGGGPIGYTCSTFPNAYGYPPPQQSSSTSPPHPSQDPQFLGLQQQQQPNSEAFMGQQQHNTNNTTNQRNQQEPHPPRPWIQLAHHKHKRTCFTVLCYNILSPHYVNSQTYSYCPTWALDWNYRRKVILQEFVHYGADIISLQEMETEQYYNFFLPQLQILGYSGIFAAKSRARTMTEAKKKWVDGCAIFYKTNKFRLLSEHLIEFSQVAISNATRCAQCSEEMLNRVQTKDNIAIAALLETKLDSEQAEGLRGLVIPRPRPLLVCTCHIHWDPNFSDVKLVQTMMLMQELKKITDGIPVTDVPPPIPRCNPSITRQNSKGHGHDTRSGSSSSSASSSTAYSFSSVSQSSPLDKVNLLVCGDFNSLPQSGVLEFIQNGTVSTAHPDFRGLNYKGYIETTKKKGIESQESCGKRQTTSSKSGKKGKLHLKSPSTETFQHIFNLKSAYSSCTMPFTNYTLDFQGVIDYVFHSVKGLRPLALLGPLDPTWLVQNNVVGVPHPQIPSDHIPLLVEMEMIPAI